MQQITEWLAKIGLERYAPAFVENDIDVSVLRYLTDADLEKIGVSLGHRRKLLAAIAELGGGPAAPTLPATDPRKQDAERTGPAPSLGPASACRVNRIGRAPLPHGDVLRPGGFDRDFGTTRC
jgi:hypothetical protein